MIVTVYTFVSHNEGEGRVEAAYTYDDADAAPRVLSAWVDNQGAHIIRYKITRESDGQVFLVDCEPGVRRDRAFNNSTPQRLSLDITNPTRPVLVGFGYEVQYPLHG